MKTNRLYLVIIVSTFFLFGCTNEIKTKEPEIQKTRIQKDIFEPEIHYTTDKINVYWDGNIVKGADPRTFQGIVGPNDTTPENLNDDDFYFFKDKNAFYMSSGPFGGNHILYRYEMENINNLVMPKGMLIHFKYVTDGESVYYLSDEGKAEKINEADIDTFKEVDGDSGYIKDKNHIYFHGKILDGADVKTFTRISLSAVYKDNKYVYFYGRILKDADAETFQAVQKKNGGICYYKDKNYVYWKVQPNPKTPTIRIVEGADPETFKCVEGEIGSGKDKNNFYKDGAVQKPVI